MRTIITFMSLVLACLPASAEDVAGSGDHPLLPRYEDSEIVRYDQQEFTDYPLLVAKITGRGGVEKNPDAVMPLEGVVTRLSYRAPADRSVLEVFRNYENALREAGFQTVYACEKAECGGREFNHAIATGTLYGLFGEYQAEQRYFAARLERTEGDVFAAVYAVMNKSGGGPNRNRAMVQVDVVELAPMEEKMVTLDAAALDAGLKTEGRIAVYGILFDFDEAEIKPDSKPQLDEIAALLKQGAGLNVLIVGHTDAKGALDYNQDLSQRRAEAVVDKLTADYGIDPARLTAVGVGMAAPVASNRTEEGRTQNRRVEIVERP